MTVSWKNFQISIARVFICLSPGQTDLQVVASGHKLNLHRDFGWVAQMDPQVSLQVRASRKTNNMVNNRLMDATRLALTWVGWWSGEKLAETCVQIWSRPKWAQVITGQRRWTQELAKQSHKKTQVASFQLASTCEVWQVCLARPVLIYGTTEKIVNASAFICTTMQIIWFHAFVSNLCEVQIVFTSDVSGCFTYFELIIWCPWHTCCHLW